MSDPLLKYVAENTQTVLWNDSADPKELANAISWGAVGATCNPIIALTALKSDKEYWTKRIKEFNKENPTATDDQIGWAMVEELSKNAAKLLEPAFEKYNGRNGRLSIQTDPRNFRDAKALADQAEYFSKLAKNIIVKNGKSYLKISTEKWNLYLNKVSPSRNYDNNLSGCGLKNKNLINGVVKISEELLKAQIEILKPDYIIFATGNEGVQARRQYFPNDKLTDKKPVGGFKVEDLWSFKLPDDDVICYRLHHPSAWGKKRKNEIESYLIDLLPSKE